MSETDSSAPTHTGIVSNGTVGHRAPVADRISAKTTTPLLTPNPDHVRASEGTARPRSRCERTVVTCLPEGKHAQCR